MINSKTFEFGNNEGQYPITGWITDSLFGVGEVSGIAYGTQYYTFSFIQGERSLNYGNAFTPVPGDKIEVYFRNPLIVQNA